jgi:hypothetical protein
VHGPAKRQYSALPSSEEGSSSVGVMSLWKIAGSTIVRSSGQRGRFDGVVVLEDGWWGKFRSLADT